MIKVEKILKGSLDSIPSSFDHCFWKQKVCWQHPGMFCLKTSKQTFPLIIRIFTENEDDGIESRLPFEIFSTLRWLHNFSLNFPVLWRWIKSSDRPWSQNIVSSLQIQWHSPQIKPRHFCIRKRVRNFLARNPPIAIRYSKLFNLFSYFHNDDINVQRCGLSKYNFGW